MNKELVDLKSVREAKEAGWKVGFFVEGEPDGMIITRKGKKITVKGIPVLPTNEIKMGVYRMTEFPKESRAFPREQRPKKKNLRVRFT